MLDKTILVSAADSDGVFQWKNMCNVYVRPGKSSDNDAAHYGFAGNLIVGGIHGAG